MIDNLLLGLLGALLVIVGRVFQDVLQALDAGPIVSVTNLAESLAESYGATPEDILLIINGVLNNQASA